MIVIENLIKNQKVEHVTYKYFYRLIKNNILISYNDESIEIESYGIEIERQDILNENVSSIEREVVKNISPEKNKVYNLLRMLYDNCVSPIHLLDVLSNYIDEYVIDFDKKLKSISM